MKCAWAVGFLIMAAIGAPAAVAQDARLAARLDPLSGVEVASVVAAAQAAGLPAEPLIDRALEGASKGASGPRIVAAVRRLAQELGAARSALGAASSDAELIAGAGALSAGARPAVLARLRAARSGEPLTVPLGVLADLVARGVPALTASSAVLSLAEARADDADFVALRRNVERDISAGAPPAIAATIRVRGMPGTAPGQATGAGTATADRPPTRTRP